MHKPADKRVKAKDYEKLNKPLDLARELKKVMVISIVDEALGTVSSDLEKRLGEPEIRERIEIIQTIALLKSAKILRRVLKVCHSDSSKNHQLKAGMEN